VEDVGEDNYEEQENESEIELRPLGLNPNGSRGFWRGPLPHREEHDIKSAKTCEREVEVDAEVLDEHDGTEIGLTDESRKRS